MKLTNADRTELQYDMAHCVLEDMSRQELYEFAYNALLDNYDRMDKTKFIELVEKHYPHLLKGFA